MAPQVRAKDSTSRAAAAAEAGPAARAMVEAIAAATEPLQEVMTRADADPRAVLAAVVAWRRGAAAIAAAEARLLAWAVVGGLTRTGAARALGIRPATLAGLLGPVETIATARAADLHRGQDGRWTVHRVNSPS